MMTSGQLFEDPALQFALQPHESELLQAVFGQIERHETVNFTQAALDCGAPSYEAASMRAYRLRKRLADHPDGKRWVMEALGVTPEKIAQVIAAALEATKYVNLAGGAVREVGDHSVRLKAVETAARLNGDLQTELPDSERMSRQEIERIAARLRLGKVADAPTG